MASAVAVVGCPATRQARSVAPSGFLGADAARLAAGGADEPKLYWVDRSAPWVSFDELLLDPVTVWRDAATARVPQADAQALANNFHRLLFAALSTDWKMVSSAGPRTLRLQVALTQLDGSDVVLNVISTAIPQLRAVTGLEGYATGKPLFTGEAGMAFKVLSVGTGELVAEGVDGRIGEKHLDDAWKKWEDVDDALRYWAQMLRFDLCRARGGSACEKPEAQKTF